MEPDLPPPTLARARLAPADRRRQLLDVAGELVSTRGVDALQVSELAQAAGVTRPVVYRFFGNRQAILVALLEDFEAELGRRFIARGLEGLAGDPDVVASVFVDVVCDTIEARGAGIWHLLDSRGPDPEIARTAGAIQQRIIQPWLPALARTTGASPREARTCASMILAAGRAVLDGWLEGRLTREEAVRDTARGIGALLTAFSA